MEGIRRALVLGVVLIAGTAIEQTPSVDGLITLIRDNITLTTTDIPTTINTHNTELQMVKVHIYNTKHITIVNIYIPP